MSLGLRCIILTLALLCAYCDESGSAYFPLLKKIIPKSYHSPGIEGEWDRKKKAFVLKSKSQKNIPLAGSFIENAKETFLSQLSKDINQSIQQRKNIDDQWNTLMKYLKLHKLSTIDVSIFSKLNDYTGAITFTKLLNQLDYPRLDRGATHYPCLYNDLLSLSKPKNKNMMVIASGITALRKAKNPNKCYEKLEATLKTTVLSLWPYANLNKHLRSLGALPIPTTDTQILLEYLSSPLLYVSSPPSYIHMAATKVMNEGSSLQKGKLLLLNLAPYELEFPTLQTTRSTYMSGSFIDAVLSNTKNEFIRPYLDMKSGLLSLSTYMDLPIPSKEQFDQYFSRSFQFIDHLYHALERWKKTFYLRAIQPLKKGECNRWSLEHQYNLHEIRLIDHNNASIACEALQTCTEMILWNMRHKRYISSIHAHKSMCPNPEMKEALARLEASIMTNTAVNSSDVTLLLETPEFSSLLLRKSYSAVHFTSLFVNGMSISHLMALSKTTFILHEKHPHLAQAVYGVLSASPQYNYSSYKEVWDFVGNNISSLNENKRVKV